MWGKFRPSPCSHKGCWVRMECSFACCVEPLVRYLTAVAYACVHTCVPCRRRPLQLVLRSPKPLPRPQPQTEPEPQPSPLHQPQPPQPQGPIYHPGEHANGMLEFTFMEPGPLGITFGDVAVRCVPRLNLQVAISSGLILTNVLGFLHGDLGIWPGPIWWATMSMALGHQMWW
jgi:hypothetical protein